MTNDVPQDGQPQKKSIRNIPLPDNRRRIVSVSDDEQILKPLPPRAPLHDERPVHAPVTPQQPRQPMTPTMHSDEHDTYEEAPEPRPRSTPPRKTRRATGRRTPLLLISIAVIVIAVLGMFFSFGGATVTVYPRQVTTTLSTEVEAITASTPTSSAALTFTAESIVAEATREVVATGEEEVVEKATGKITIVNEYSEEEQRLLKNTRFESPNGLIFRIPDSVVVPGYTRDASGNVVAGTLVAEVVADEVGKEYNIGATRFTVPGFKDMPQYSSFYATSETQMTGGFDGVKKIVSAEDRNRAERELREDIKQQLLARAAERKTDTNIVLTDDSLTLYETLEETSAGDKVVLGMRGTTKAVVLEVQSLAYVLAQSELNSFSSTDVVRITNLETLQMRAFAKTGDTSFNAVRIAVEGDAAFEWVLDEEAFKKALAGSDKNELATIVPEFKAITKASAKIRPIWKGSFSNNPEKITIVYAKE